MFNCQPGQAACAEACYEAIEQACAGTGVAIDANTDGGCLHQSSGLEVTLRSIECGDGLSRTVVDVYTCVVSGCGRAVLRTVWAFTCQKPR